MLHQGDCLEVLRTLPDNSVDSLVTDPPAGISFMGKSWDDDKGGRDQWIKWMSSVMKECLRVMKPGAHGLVWALPRTSHWTAMALENAGFEVRDRIQHLFGSGFPKSLDVSKAIDKAAGAERDILRTLPSGSGPLKRGHVASTGGGMSIGSERSPEIKITAPATAAAKQWVGWGTALKPACEDWWLIRKPLKKCYTVAQNVQEFGTGAINVDASRIPTDRSKEREYDKEASSGTTGSNKAMFAMGDNQPRSDGWLNHGRFPSHLVLSHSEHCTDDACDMFSCPVAMLDAQSGERGISKGGSRGGKRTQAFGMASQDIPLGFGDSGGASRFFYCAKVSSSERNAAGPNGHPTVKPQKLMRYLARLITPPGGTILDCFMGSGSTGLAAKSEGFGFVGIEREAEYFEIAKARVG